MPKIRKRSEVEEANLYQLSEVYKSKLRKLDCRKNKKPNMSDIANKPVPSENKKLPSKIFKQLYCKERTKKKRSCFIDVNKILKKPKSKPVQTPATNGQEFITQFCENCNQNLRALDCSRDRELEPQQGNKKTQTDVDLSRKENLPTSEIETVFRNSSLEYNAENKSSTNDVSTAHCSRDSVDQNFTQDDSEILSPEYSPIRHTEAKLWLETNRAKIDLPNSGSDSNRLSEGVVDNAKYIPTEKHGGTSNDFGICVISSVDRIYAQFHQGEKAYKGNLKIDMQKKPEIAQIESNTLEDSNSSKKTIVKETLRFPTASKNLLTEKDKLADFLSSSYSVKKSKIVDEKIDPVFCKAPEENTFEIKNSLEEKKRCPRYAIPLENISNKYEYHEFPIPILKPIQNHQLPAQLTLHVEQYFFIQNCPVVKCLSYLHRFPHSSSTNVWTFLCPTPSKICLPNFIFISTALTPLPVLYNKNLYKFFENFMNIYSELKVGDNFILLNLLTDNESPISTACPLQFSTEYENIISTALFNKLVSKINKARPTVIMETESIESSDFDHPCLFKKFGNFMFFSLNIINIKEFSSERQVGIFYPFTVQKDSCSCTFVDRKITLACPIKSFLLALTNNIQFIQSVTHIDSAVRPLEGIHTCALQKRGLSPKLDVQKISKQLKSKKRKITRNPCKVMRLKKQESKISVGENIALRTVERKKECQTIGTNIPKVKINVGENIALRTAKRKEFQTIGTNMPKVKRSKTQTKISFDENILPLNFIKENPTVANPHKLKYSEKQQMISIDRNMQVLSAALGEFRQSISPKTVPMAQFPEMKNLFVQKCISLPSPKSKNIEHPLVSNSEIKTCPSVSKASESSKPQILLREYSQNKSVSSMVVDENLPLCLVQKSNTRHGSMQVVSNHSAAMVIRNNKNVRSKSHSSFELNNLEDLNSEPPVNTKLSIPNDLLELVKDLPSSSQNSATLSSNLVQNMTFKANNIQTSIKTINTEQIGKKSEQIGKKLNTVATELINSKSLSCHNITLSNSPTNSGTFTEANLQHDRIKFNLLGFMEVHFFEPIKGRNPNLRLLVRIPNSINTTVFAVDKMHIYPNAILFQSQQRENVVKTFLYVRKITSIAEIEGFIFDHENTSAPINGFDKQTFIFQPTTSQKMPPKCEFENLRRLSDSFLPNGMYLLTPVRKKGACEIEIYKKLKNKHLSELKTEIGICYNLGKECVEVEDLLNIPDHLFFDSNVQLTDIF